jgi:transposase InsO family protein
MVSVDFRMPDPSRSERVGHVVLDFASAGLGLPRASGIGPRKHRATPPAQDVETHRWANATDHPTASWTAQQVVDAFPDARAPRWLLRDRGTIYSNAFHRRVSGMGIREVVSSPMSPWQSPYVESLIGSIRRECLNPVIVLNPTHLRRVLAAYIAYYHRSRTHLGLNKDARRPAR